MHITTPSIRQLSPLTLEETRANAAHPHTHNDETNNNSGNPEELSLLAILFLTGVQDRAENTNKKIVISRWSVFFPSSQSAISRSRYRQIRKPNVK